MFQYISIPSRDFDLITFSSKLVRFGNILIFIEIVYITFPLHLKGFYSFLKPEVFVLYLSTTFFLTVLIDLHHLTLYGCNFFYEQN